MGIPLAWFGVTGAATFINGATLGFLAHREGNRALRLWAWAWFAWAAAVVPLTRLDPARPSVWASLLCGLLWVASALCFLRGSYAFADRKMPAAWFAIAAVCVALAGLLGMDAAGAPGMVPLVLFQSVGVLATGVLLIRNARQRSGAWLSGGSLMLLALHILDAPLLSAHPALLPWGFVVAMGLEVLTALGMIMLYYEHARAQLIETQRVLAETSRTEALGRIAGGVAHDFNNMLTVMQAHADFIGLYKDNPERLDESLKSIDQAVQQASRLTSKLLAFGRRSVIQPEAINIREVIEGTLELLQKVMPADIQLTFVCSEGSYNASMDRALLEQIVLNLVTNARDAIAAPGNITVDLTRQDQPAPQITLRVTDTGCGMDDTLVSKAFEPFFTTKAMNRGTGLGLASVQGAVSQMHGQVRVESQVDKGTTFEVRLPVVGADAVPAVESGAPNPGALDVLVVDDDEQVRHVVLEILRLGGHRVEEACNGIQALDLIATRRFDVVLSDVIMPEMGGLALRKAVMAQQPETLVLLTSGYPPGVDLGTAANQFLPKPFQRTTLLNVITRLVAEHRRQQTTAVRPA